MSKIDINLIPPELRREYQTIDYKPSLEMNGLLVALFGISFIAFFYQGIRYKMWGFMFTMCMGCACKFLETCRLDFAGWMLTAVFFQWKSVDTRPDYGCTMICSWRTRSCKSPVPIPNPHATL